jgi:hypothetical protein
MARYGAVECFCRLSYNLPKVCMAGHKRSRFVPDRPEKGPTMNSGSTVLTVLRQARELLVSGETPCIISAISSLKGQSSSRTRDLAYFAVMETMMLGGAETTISSLAQPENQANALRMIEDTIKRMTSTLH